MEPDHVAGPDLPAQRFGARAQRLLVDPTRLGVQRSAVTRRPVQAVVYPLGHLEEPGVPRDDDPARVEAGTDPVADQRAQHLGDAAAVRRRVDVPDRHAVQEAAQPGEASPELLVAWAVQDLLEPLRLQARYVVIAQHSHHIFVHDQCGEYVRMRA